MIDTALLSKNHIIYVYNGVGFKTVAAKESSGN